MLWSVFSREIRLDHRNGPSRSLAQWCLISVLTLNYSEKRRFLRNKVKFCVDILQDYQQFTKVFRERGGAGAGRSSLAGVNGAVCGVQDWASTGVGDSSGLTLNLGGLRNAATCNCPSGTFWCAARQLLSCCRQCLGKLSPSFDDGSVLENIRCLFSCPSRRLLSVMRSSNVWCGPIMNHGMS